MIVLVAAAEDTSARCYDNGGHPWSYFSWCLLHQYHDDLWRGEDAFSSGEHNWVHVLEEIVQMSGGQAQYVVDGGMSQTVAKHHEYPRKPRCFELEDSHELHCHVLIPPRPYVDKHEG